ncbi:MAG: acetylglutamate kinase [Planctomycetes bacterium]|nr:acetylglutamate kinase [Planctomycetota bacterium]
MTTEHDRGITITAIRSAVPYLRLYQGRTFVIKAGGDVFQSRETTRALMEQVGVLHQLGIRIILVHGGGGQATDLAGRLGVESRFVEGRRVTDREMREVATMTLNGSVNTAIVAVCRELEVPALGISGVDAGLVRARRRPPRLVAGEDVDYGYVGDIVSVETGVLERILSDGFVPIVSPLSADDSGEVLNINADVIAARLAKELKAEKLVVVTSAPGILERSDDPQSLVSYTDVKGLNDLQEKGALEGGMIPKVTAIKDALYGGVTRVHVISWKVRDALLLEVFTNDGCGTLVVLDTKELRPEEANSSRIERLMNDVGGDA